MKPTGEEGIQLIKALCGLTRKISNVNIPNTGHQIANLPESAVVETNAVFERDAIRPLYAGELPEQIKELVDPHVANHERILKAAILCDFDLVVEAFLEDPQVKGRASREQGGRAGKGYAPQHGKISAGRLEKVSVKIK